MKNYKDLDELITFIEVTEQCRYHYDDTSGLHEFIYNDEIISFYDYIDEKNYCSDYNRIYNEIKRHYNYLWEREKHCL